MDRLYDCRDSTIGENLEMKRLLVSVASLLSLLWMIPASSTQCDDAYKQGDYAAALKTCKLLAEQGGASAEYTLGYMYYYGNGVTKDYNKAFESFTRAANLGSSSAQYLLAESYDIGRGVDKDELASYMWLYIATTNGDTNAADLIYLVENSSSVSSSLRNEARRLARKWKDEHEN